ncbi:monocarboxylate transporter 2 isoform X2 [Hoplias malabaricus]|uniref:monocarboxylate transporter 2 isoform X2 n=1 Tax=Hoplias malabaricus TaxID=27720 RepID=UPI003462E044
MESAVKRHAAGPPDGGYGWFIVLATFLVFGLTFGVIKSFGVFYVEINHYFATSATATSWITSISIATVHIGAPVGSVMSACFGHRAVVMLGGLLSSMGMVTGAFAQNLLQLYITVGFLTGFGYALTWTPTVTMLGCYFEKRRPMANALASAGECIITFLFTPFFQLLVDVYSWRGAMLLLGAVLLNLCVCGALLRPLSDLSDQHSAVLDRIELEDLSQPHTDLQETSRKSETIRSKVLRYVDYTLITNSHFMVYSMFGVFAALGFFAPALFLVPYARSQGIEEYQAAALMSISAALDLFGRLLFGWVANLQLVKTIHQLTVTVIFLGVVLLLCPLATTFTQLAIFSSIYGLVFGATVAIHITVLAEVVGVNRLGSALGFFMLIRSSGGLLGPPLADDTEGPRHTAGS